MRDLSVRSYKREKRPRVIILASNGTLFVLEPEACISTTLCSSVSNARKSSNRFVELGAAVNKLRTNGKTESRDAIEDLAHRIRLGVKTTVTDHGEVNMQRWYVDSFINGAFELRRHKCADAAMAVYGVSPDS